MAVKTWIGTTDTAFGTAGNWSPSGVPADGDTIIFNAQMIRSLAGSDQSAIEPARIIIYASASNSYSIGSAAAPLTIGPLLCDIDYPDPAGGSSTGLSQICIDFGTDPVICTLYGGPNTGTSGQEARLIAGVNAADELYVKDGVVGLGTMTSGQASTFPVIGVTGGALNIGTNVTATTVTVKGGTVQSESVIPTLNQYEGGSTKTHSLATITTLNLYGGTVEVDSRPASGATIGTCNLRGGTLDLSQDLRAITITALSDGGGTIKLATSAQLTATGTTVYMGDKYTRQTNLS